ncbi:MAG TPA: nucleoside diphosphate kinase regulator [Bryobacteraceae bacterium]|nr:nucleoside diphosphate kinase regulator [Bryobacteraceae bacterium]
MRDRLIITAADQARLRALVEGRMGGGQDAEYLARLEEELDRADVVPDGKVPKDVITMNSEVRLMDLDTKEEKVYRLVYPTQGRPENAISILAPIGTALLGYRVGDTIKWQVPRGMRRFKVLEVLYQPEAAGVNEQ